jgi:NADPH:quinone reductase
LFPAIRDGGGFVAVRGFAGAEERGIKFHVTWVWEYWKATEKLEQLRALTELGAVTLRVAQEFPAANACEAHRILEAGGTRGRLVLVF